LLASDFCAVYGFPNFDFFIVVAGSKSSHSILLSGKPDVSKSNVKVYLSDLRETGNPSFGYPIDDSGLNDKGTDGKGKEDILIYVGVLLNTIL
jgi:hypothetical protein